MRKSAYALSALQSGAKEIAVSKVTALQDSKVITRKGVAALTLNILDSINVSTRMVGALLMLTYIS